MNDSKPVFASLLLGAAKLDEDIKKGLKPKEFGNITRLSKQFSELILNPKKVNIDYYAKIISQIDSIDLPQFTKSILVAILINNNLREKNENLK